MSLPPLLDPAKLFFFIDPNEKFSDIDFKKLNSLFALPGDKNLRSDNIHFILCLMHDCMSIDSDRYLNDVFLPWTSLKRRTEINKERILHEFSRIGDFTEGTSEDQAHLLNIYRNIVSDLFDPYLSLIFASYQFKSGSFKNMNDANLSQGERNKVEYISARKECAHLLSGYDANVRNAISHSGSHGVTYKDDEIIFRNISRGTPVKVTMVTWSTTELEKRIFQLFECIISIDAAENIFGIDCIDKITSNVNTYLNFLNLHSSHQERKKISERVDALHAGIRQSTLLTTEEKLEKIAPIFFFNCAERKLPVASLGLSSDRKTLSISVPIGDELPDDEAMIYRLSQLLRYGIIAQGIFKDIFSYYRIIEFEKSENKFRLSAVSPTSLLNDYSNEEAGLVDLLNDSMLFENGQPIAVRFDFDSLKNLEMTSLEEPFPRYKR